MHLMISFMSTESYLWKRNDPAFYSFLIPGSRYFSETKTKSCKNIHTIFVNHKTIESFLNFL